jgi:hypothetical protein
MYKPPACRGGGSAAGPLLAVLRCRCATLLVLVLMSTLAMPNCGVRKALLLSDPRTLLLLISYKESKQWEVPVAPQLSQSR